jgi:hypothetical protein
MKIIFIFVFLLLNALMFSYSLEIKGQISIQDEKEHVYRPAELEKRPSMYIRIFYKEGGNLEYCDEKFWVTNKLRFNAVILGNKCRIRGKQLYLELKFEYSTPAGWIIRQPLPSVIFNEDNAPWDHKDIVIVRSRNPKRKDRLKNFANGQRIYSESPEKSLPYFIESSIGDDIEFTAASVNFLYAKGNQKMEYDILKQKDFSKIEMDKNTRFKFLMRRANAARAAGKYTEALADYSGAQKIIPTNITPISMAYTTIKDRLKITGLSELEKVIDNYPQLKEELKAVYFYWDYEGKPKLIELIEAKDNYGTFNPAALAFTGENIKEIKEGEKIKKRVN